MKILTVTTSYANNMGALLQCYALSKYINNLDDVNCEIMDFHPPRWEESWNIIHKPKTFRDFVKMCFLLCQFDRVRNRRRKNQVMNDFRLKHLPLTKQQYFSQTIEEKYPTADICICGSDQIWNMTLKQEPTFFLDFCKHNPQCKRVSYAASIAEAWTKEGCKRVLPWLKKFDKISIREIGNLEQVQSLVPEKNPTVVCDPVFLLDSTEWDKLARESQEKEPYIFCYFLSVSDHAVQTVKKLREMTGYKVVHLNLNALDKFNSDENITVADPCDFVGLIKNATLVCTNSFHCTAFSIIYQKDLVVVPNATRNERMYNVQEKFKIDVMMTKEKLANLTLDDLKVDYSVGKASGEEYIQHSKQFLHDAIYG